MSMPQGALDGQHILLVAEYLHFGGTRDYLLRLLDLYYEQGAMVTMVTTFLEEDPAMKAFMDYRGFDLTTFPRVLEAAGIHGVTGHPTVWSLRQFKSESRAFHAFARDVQATRVVVSVGTPGLLFSAAAALPRSVVFAHSYPHGRRQEVLGRQYLSRLIPKETTIVSLSDYQTRCISDLWDLARSRSRVVTILSTSGVPCGERDAGEAPLTVLTASLVEPYKRPLDWVEVADSVLSSLPVNSTEFVWLGEGSLLEQARDAARKKPNANHIHFPGFCAEPEGHYEKATIYLQLSSIENMSLSVLNAQRHGTPCVVTDIGGFPEIIEDGTNGFVVSCGDVGAAVKALVRLLSDTATRTTQSAASLRRYSQKHSPEVWKQAVIKAHENFIS